MSSTPSRPRKRRRIDLQGSKDSNIPSQVLPLVLPNQVPKSSKDPNRGMYPRNDKIKNKRSFSCVSFTKASRLLKESSGKRGKGKKSEDTDISLADISIQEDGPSKRTSKQLKDAGNKIEVESSTSSSEISFKTRKFPYNSKFESAARISNKIMSYFKPVPGTSVKKKTSEKTICANDIPGTSGSRLPSNEEKTKLSEKRNEIFFRKFRNCYGLLGEENDIDEECPNYFEKLPQHVFETILCQIPFVDLMKYSLVCSTWKEVIGDPKFVEWKKRYYGLKMNVEACVTYMESICASLNMANVEDSFKVLLQFMSREFNRKPSLDMYELLMTNRKAVDAKFVIAERFPELLSKESKVWCILTAAMLISESVSDVYYLYHAIMTEDSDCSLHDITDAFYCVAAFLFFFKCSHGINHGLHYRVYSALYWIENDPPLRDASGLQRLRIARGLPGQQSIHGYCETSKTHLTNEQLRILNHCFQPGQILKIVALAGTGKTTTLIHLSQLYPQVKFLNVMFNKAVCDEAKKRFPPNVTCKTAHSLAFKIFGNRLRFKLTTKVRPHDLVAFLEHHAGSRLNIHTYAKHVLVTLESFVCSADQEITLSHVPTVPPIQTDKNKSFKEEDRPKLLKDAIQIWEKMIDRENKTLKITHDVYLKLYQLSKPKFTEFQCLMVDEAQDSNPAMLDIMMSQNLPVVLVGDPNQQIYGFRGANNALQSIESTHTYYLTKSFRFGPDIAYIASCCLEVLKSNHAQTLVGSNKYSTIIGKREGQYAIIARTNVQLFYEAFRLCCQKRFKPFEPDNIQGCFAGGIKSYGFDQIVDIQKLFTNPEGKPVPTLSDKFIAKFKSFKELDSYANSVEDKDLLAKIDIVKQHGSNVIEFIRSIKDKCSHPMALANVVFSTAHKSKGLEFDTVCLTDDYPVVPGIDYRRRHYGVRLGVPGPVDAEESNILYVAVTRAKRSLILPDKMLRILLAAQEKFEYPMRAVNVLTRMHDIECVGCSELFAPHTVLIMVRRKMFTSNGRAIEGGIFCTKCATEPTVRPRIQVDPVIMYLDPTADYAHRSMAALVGPLPSDPPIIRNSMAALHEMDLVYVINVNM